jgi:hypothetical protein
MIDFSENLTEETAYTLKRAQEYVALALKNGDVAFQDKVGQITIMIKKPKQKKVEK